MDNMTKDSQFCAQEEASSVNEEAVAQMSLNKVQGDEFRPPL